MNYRVEVSTSMGRTLWQWFEWARSNTLSDAIAYVTKRHGDSNGVAIIIRRAEHVR